MTRSESEAGRVAFAPKRLSLLVGAVGLVGATLFAVAFVNVYGGIVNVVRVSDAEPDLFAYVQSRLNGVEPAPGLGHDGRFFFVQANDPLLLRPFEHAALLDHPEYRSQRMLYPLLAGGLGLLPPSAVVWGMVAVNVIAVGLGTWSAARLSTLRGSPAVIGLAFLLNPGVLWEMSISGASVVGSALAFCGILSLERRRLLLGGLLLALGALARESMLIVAIGCLAYVWLRERRWKPSIALIPLLAVAGWAAWVWWRLASVPGTAADDGIGANFAWPFLGLIAAIRSWAELGGLELAMGLIVAISSGVVAWRAVRQPSMLSWGVVGFVAMLAVLSPPVTDRGFNLTRAVIPVITGGLLLVLGRGGRQELDQGSKESAPQDGQRIPEVGF